MESQSIADSPGGGNTAPPTRDNVRPANREDTNVCCILQGSPYCRCAAYELAAYHVQTNYVRNLIGLHPFLMARLRAANLNLLSAYEIAYGGCPYIAEFISDAGEDEEDRPASDLDKVLQMYIDYGVGAVYIWHATREWLDSCLGELDPHEEQKFFTIYVADQMGGTRYTAVRFGRSWAVCPIESFGDAEAQARAWNKLMHMLNGNGIIKVLITYYVVYVAVCWLLQEDHIGLVYHLDKAFGHPYVHDFTYSWMTEVFERDGGCQDAWNVMECNGKSECNLATQFRKLSLKYHPDKGGSAADFNRLREAYETLKRCAARDIYNFTPAERMFFYRGFFVMVLLTVALGHFTGWALFWITYRVRRCLAWPLIPVRGGRRPHHAPGPRPWVRKPRSG